MNKGYTLIELVMSMGLGLVVVMGTLELHYITLKSWQHLRHRTNVSHNLSLAHDELSQYTRAAEPEFWRDFPRKPNLIHPNTTPIDAVDKGRQCPYYANTDCLTTWDLKPVTAPALTYRLEGAVNQPIIFVDPHENQYPVGPAEDVGPMSVFLFVSIDEVFPAVVSRFDDQHIRLLNPLHQPWPIPETFDPNIFQAVHLGRLEVNHHTRRPDADHTGVLMRHPFTLTPSGWKKQRGVSSATFLAQMLWGTTPDTNAGLLLVGAEEMPKPLEKTIAGHQFSEEVQLVVLSY